MKNATIISVFASLVIHSAILALIYYPHSVLSKKTDSSLKGVSVQIVSLSKYDAVMSNSPGEILENIEQLVFQQPIQLYHKGYEISDEPVVPNIKKYNDVEKMKQISSVVRRRGADDLKILNNQKITILSAVKDDYDLTFLKVKSNSSSFKSMDMDVLEQSTNMSYFLPKVDKTVKALKRFTEKVRQGTLKEAKATSSKETKKEQPLSSKWGAAIEQVVLENLVYPKQALENELTGRVFLKLEIYADGTILEVHIRRSSGHLILDRAAKSAVLRSKKLPAAPDSYPNQKFIFNLPVSFSV